jgi:hypothetical protein
VDHSAVRLHGAVLNYVQGQLNLYFTLSLTEFEVLLPCSQEPIAGPYLRQDESSPYTTPCFPETRLNDFSNEQPCLEVTIRTCIQDVLGWHLDRVTGYHN